MQKSKGAVGFLFLSLIFVGNTFATLPALAGPPKRAALPRQHKTEIGYMAAGRLKVQLASGGVVRPATPDEKKEWDYYDPDSGAPTGSSAHGYFIHPALPLSQGITMIDKEGGVIENEKGVAVRQGWLKKALPDSLLSVGIPDVLEGWLPDERHFALIGSGNSSWSTVSSRLVVDAATGRPIAFNGWVEPNMKRGILPTGNNDSYQGKSGLYVEAPHGTMIKMKDNDGSSHMEHSGKTEPPRTRYVIIPVPKPISRFRSLSETKGAVPLILNGKPFIFQSNERDYASHSGTLAQFIFSKDGQWALCRHDLRGSILFSMVNGRGRIIPDKAARFVEPLSEEARTETDND